MRIKRLGALSVGEPVTLQEAKAHLIVTFDDDDAQITTLITRARQAVENYCNISIVPQRLQASFKPCTTKIPYGPVITLESVQGQTYNTGYGSLVYEALSDYYSDGDTLDIENYPNHISTRDRYFDYPIRVTYTAGMETVPEDLKGAILAQVAWLYENRGNMATGGLSQEAMDLAAPYRVLAWI